MSKLVGLFPGQGSQGIGMGQTAYEQSDLAKELFARADKALGFSLSKLCFEGPLETLTLTQNAQPAILTVSAVCYELAGRPELAAAAGHSLGEFSALLAAGTLSFEDAVVLVHKRGQYMQEAVQPGLGGMSAIMGPSEDEIRSELSKIDGIVEIANLNCPGQTVIAGEIKALSAANEALQTAGAKVIPLNVSAPFHCQLMEPAAKKLESDLAATSFNDPKFPVFANVSAEAISSGEAARALLVSQVTGSVRWTESMQNIIAAHSPELCVEFGHGDVLSKLLKRIDKSIARAQVKDLESAEALKTRFA